MFMEWIFIGSILLGALSSIGSGSISKSRQDKLLKAWKPVLQAIAKDNQLVTELESAYNRKDSRLIQSIMAASPFSSDFSKMRQDYRQNQRDISDLSKKKVSLAKEQADLQEEYNKQMQKAQNTGSIIGNLVGGGVDTSKLNYNGSGISENKIKEINNG